MRLCWAPTSGYNGRLDHGRRPAWVNRFDQRSDPGDVRARHGCPGHELIRIALGRQDADSGSSYVRLFKQNKGFDAFGRATFWLQKYIKKQSSHHWQLSTLENFYFLEMANPNYWFWGSNALRIKRVKCTASPLAWLVLLSRSLNFQTAHSDP